MTEPGQYTDAYGRIDPTLTEHEVIRTARDATAAVQRLASQLAMMREPDVYDEAKPALALLRDAQQRLEHQLRLIWPRMELERGRRLAAKEAKR